MALFDSAIKVVQRTTLNITGSNVTGTATITAVDTSKTFINLLGSVTDTTADAATLQVRVALTNSTTVTATRYPPSGSQTMAVSIEIVEFL